jgi:hypothetical protein
MSTIYMVYVILYSQLVSAPRRTELTTVQVIATTARYDANAVIRTPKNK